MPGPSAQDAYYGGIAHAPPATLSTNPAVHAIQTLSPISSRWASRPMQTLLAAAVGSPSADVRAAAFHKLALVCQNTGAELALRDRLARDVLRCGVRDSALAVRRAAYALLRHARADDALGLLLGACLTAQGHREVRVLLGLMTNVLRTAAAAREPVSGGVARRALSYEGEGEGLEEGDVAGLLTDLMHDAAWGTAVKAMDVVVELVPVVRTEERVGVMRGAVALMVGARHFGVATTAARLLRAVYKSGDASLAPDAIRAPERDLKMDDETARLLGKALWKQDPFSAVSLCEAACCVVTQALPGFRAILEPMEYHLREVDQLSAAQPVLENCVAYLCRMNRSWTVVVNAMRGNGGTLPVFPRGDGE